MSVSSHLIVVTISMLSAALPTGAQEWSRFRGPNGSGVSSSKSLPVEFGPDTNLRWTTGVPFARSSPVLTHDRVFLTAVDDGAFAVLALDRSSGEELWRRSVNRDRHADMHHDTDSGTPSPVTDGQNVFAFFQESGLVAFDGTGDEIWRVPLGPFRNFYSLAASPILAGDTLLLVCDQNTGSFLLALDKATGRQVWRQERPGRSLSYATPILFPDSGDPREVLVLGDRWIDSYDLFTGESRWMLGGLGSGPVSSPVQAGDLLIVNAPDQAPEPPPPFSDLAKEHDANGDGVLTRQEVEGTWMTKHFGFVDWDGDDSLSADDWESLHEMMGTEDWGIHAIRVPAQESEPEIVWSLQQSVPYIPTGIVYEDVLYMVKDGIVSSIDPRTGELYKRGRLTQGSPKVYSSPVAGDGKIYIATLKGEIAVLAAGAQWEVLTTNDLQDEIWATPAIHDGQIFVRTRQSLSSFTLPTGSEMNESP